MARPATYGTKEQVFEIYSGVWGAAPDFEGVDYWVAQIDAGTFNFEDTASSFFDQPLVQAKYDGLTGDDLLTALYQNIFKVETPDAEGFAYWQDIMAQLDINDIESPLIGNLVMQMIDGMWANELAVNAQALFQNFVTASDLFYDFQIANDLAAYSTMSDADQQTFLSAARDLVEGLTADSTQEEIEAAVAEAGEVVAPAPVGETFALTADSPSIIVLTDKDDTVEAGTFLEGKTIIDQGGNDVLNATLNAALTAATTIEGVEQVNLDWNAFGTATVDADKIDGATITGTSSKLGFLGSFTVNNAGANDVTAGAGMVGTLNVNGATDSVVDGGVSKTVNVDGSGAREDNVAAVVTAGANTTTINVGANDGFDSVSVTGGAKTTDITVNDSNAITVAAAAATSVNLDGTAETDDTATVTLGVDADLLLGATEEIEDVTINAADGITVDITGSDIKKVTVASAGTATLVAAASELTTNTIVNQTAGLTVEVDHDGAANLDKVAADLIKLTSTNGSALTFATGANVLVDEGVDLNAAASFVGKSATTGVLNLTILNDQTNDIAVTTLKTLNLTIDDQDLDDDEVATLGGITSANDVNLITANDVVVTALAVKNLDASQSSGDLTVTQDFGDEALVSLVGAQGNNTVTLTDVDSDVSIVTGEGDDKVVFDDNAAATGDVTLVLGNGDNEVDGSTNGISDADLSIVTGTGDDVVNVILVNAVNMVAELGSGNNEVTLDTSNNGGDQNVTVVTGSGNDTLIFAADTSALDTIVWNAGTGTDTLDIDAADITAGSITLAGVEQIKFTDATSVVDGNLLHNASYKLLGEGDNTAGVFTDQLDVTIGTAGTYNFSGLTFDNTLAKGAAGLDISGSVAGGDTIVATTGNDVITVTAGTNTVTGGKGADAITLQAAGGATTVVIAAGDTGKTAATVDSITNFDTTADKLKIGIAGSATTFAAIDVDTGATNQLANAAAAVAAANTLFGAGQAGEGKSVLFLYDSDTGADGWLAIDRNGDKVVDELVQLVGLTAGTDVVATDIIA